MDVDVDPISIVVPTAYRPDLLRDCLATLIRQDFPNELYEIIVVDDGDGEARAVVESFNSSIDKRITYVECGKHDLNSARNLGIRSAQAEVVCLVDDDIFAPPEWLRKIAEAVHRHPDVECFAAGVEPLFEGRLPRSCGCPLPGSTLDLGPDEHEFVAGSAPSEAWGCNMVLRKTAIDRVGPFREGMKLGMADETEWQLRLCANGGRELWIADASVQHRRLQSHLRPRYLLRRHFWHGMTMVELGFNITPRKAIGSLLYSLRHALKRRCFNGLFRAAHGAGMGVALIRGRRGIQREDVTVGSTTLTEASRRNDGKRSAAS